MLSHGTITGRNLEASRRFYEEFLGLDCVRHLEKTDRALADYLREARKWGDSLVTTRNNLDHGDWTLQGAAVADAAGRVAVTEPAIAGAPVTKSVADVTDRIRYFVEDVIAHCIQQRLAHGITLAEIPVTQRVPEMPLRFRNTVTGGGLPAWQIRYHASRFDET
jgi:catechol 2,3-dioxygenase-like lactoylglutathione lyase family enzyme